METTTATTTRTPGPATQVELYDGRGRLIGVITRPAVSEVLGPGREKVYLSRRAPGPVARDDRRPSQAA
ncbi:MAG: hypothetical protein OEW77_01490 [Gemmatimonadota bacterium]|nr:hypothetical protein [Gemmatimonadota bacterium]